MVDIYGYPVLYWSIIINRYVNKKRRPMDQTNQPVLWLATKARLEVPVPQLGWSPRLWLAQFEFPWPADLFSNGGHLGFSFFYYFYFKWDLNYFLSYKMTQWLLLLDKRISSQRYTQIGLHYIAGWMRLFGIDNGIGPVSDIQCIFFLEHDSRPGGVLLFPPTPPLCPKLTFIRPGR